jgi:hypothetical protein
MVKVTLSEQSKNSELKTEIKNAPMNKARPKKGESAANY